MPDRLGQGAASEEPSDESLADQLRGKVHDRYSNEELRRDKLAEEHARQEEARREEFTRFMNEKVRPTFVDAYDEQTADSWMDRIWEEVRR